MIYLFKDLKIMFKFAQHVIKAYKELF